MHFPNPKVRFEEMTNTMDLQGVSWKLPSKPAHNPSQQCRHYCSCTETVPRLFVVTCACMALTVGDHFDDIIITKHDRTKEKAGI
jgi:hypothetical protein